MKLYKGYIIKPHPINPSSYIIATEGVGGSIPASMDGLFTSASIAMRAVDLYLVPKEENNGRKSNKAISKG